MVEDAPAAGAKGKGKQGTLDLFLKKPAAAAAAAAVSFSGHPFLQLSTTPKLFSGTLMDSAARGWLPCRSYRLLLRDVRQAKALLLLLLLLGKVPLAYWQAILVAYPSHLYISIAAANTSSSLPRSMCVCRAPRAHPSPPPRPSQKLPSRPPSPQVSVRSALRRVLLGAAGMHGGTSRRSLLQPAALSAW
jgi:hypothetical protein